MTGYREQHGLTIYGISPTNEPDLTTGYSSCRWTGAQLRDFIKQHLGPTLARDGVSVKVIMPESMHLNEDYALDSLADAAARQAIDIIGTHAYDFGRHTFPVAKQWGKPIWQTEVCALSGSDNSIGSGLRFATVLHEHLTVSEVSAWNYWWLVSCKDEMGSGLIKLDLAAQTYTVLKTLFVVGNFSRFIRPGYRRLDMDAAPGDEGIHVSAYRDSGSNAFVIIAVHTGAQAAPIEVHLEGFPEVAQVTPFRTSSQEDLAPLAALPVTGGGFTATLAPESVTSFVGRALEAEAWSRHRAGRFPG